ncbi:MAG TPA: NAD(+) diphosphatase [Rhodobacteraceae bacterium]|nr:NAD(+) diphosphatase [Paracoccaceae bacterium]
MRHAEDVTFGGSGLDRAAHIRADDAALARARAHPEAGAVVLWHGKPLVEGEGLDRLARVPLAHPVLNAGLARPVDAPVLLGVEEDRPLFAVDISGWQPEDQETATVGAFVDPSLQRHPDLPEATAFAELRRIMTRLDIRDAELAASARAVIGWHDTHLFCARCGAPSRMVQGGWQRHCPSCGASHFPRTDPVVIMLITHGNSVLMGRSPGWPEGMYSLLAGFVEPGETLEAAVRREVAEEAGIRVGAVSYLASQPWPFPASLMIGCAGEALTREITLDPAELEDAIWVTREDMAEAFAGVHSFIKPARKGAIAHFLLENWLADRLD